MSNPHHTTAPTGATIRDNPTLYRQFVESLKPDYAGYYLSAIAALARLDTASVQDIAEDLSPEHRQRALDPRRGLPHYIQLLQDLMGAIEVQRPSLKVVRQEHEETGHAAG